MFRSMKNLGVCVSISLLCVLLSSCGSKEESARSAATDAAKVSVPDPSATVQDKALKQIRDFVAAQNIDRTKPKWKESLKKPPQAEFDSDHEYFWNVDTNKGRIRLQLLPEVAPMHVTSAIYLVEAGFYDNLKFHRVIPGFMAQGGCPQGTGRGGPGYKMAGEYSPNVRHDGFGLLSAANSGEGTDGSQFFITFKATRHLDDKHTIYGKVAAGVSTVRALEQAGSSPQGTPSEPLLIVRSSIDVE